jgi:putative hydrolase of the HAD superfamily
MNLKGKMSTINASIEYIAFDLGGVLIELDNFPRLVIGASDQTAQDRFWHQWLTSCSVRAFECGKLSFQEFVPEFFHEHQVSISEQEFIHAFKRLPKRPFPGVKALLKKLALQWPLVVISNNNEVHWNTVLNQWGFGLYFHKAYSSHLIGKVKPDAEIFEFVVSDLNIPPSHILFIDDNRLNVDAALEVGLLAEVGKGVQEICDILSNYHILNC